MNTAVTVSPQQAAALEQVLIGGDLSRLKPEERILYYKQVCESQGLNPLTKPFEYITLNGKMVLYALRSCTEQLRKIHGVSIIIVSREVVEDCYVVTARATDAKGRNDESIGAVPIASLKGEARSNAMMKSETKAKRRVTLSICGLGMLDESEVDSVPGSYPEPITPKAGVMKALPIKRQEVIAETAAQIRGLMKNDQNADAYAIWQCSGFDTEENIALWSLLDSKERGILDRMGEAERSQNSGVISEAKRKRLEALIKEKGLNREAVKKYCKEEFGADHFHELSNVAYGKLDIEISHGNPAFTPSGIAAPQPSTANDSSGDSKESLRQGEVASAATINDDQESVILDLITAAGMELKHVLQHKDFKLKTLRDLPKARYQELVDRLKAKAQEAK